jgi:hypothetical protein
MKTLGAIILLAIGLFLASQHLQQQCVIAHTWQLEVGTCYPFGIYRAVDLLAPATPKVTKAPTPAYPDPCASVIGTSKEQTCRAIGYVPSGP